MGDIDDGADERELPYSSLAEAWPTIRSILRRRLRNGYKIVDPKEISQETM